MHTHVKTLENVSRVLKLARATAIKRNREQPLAGYHANAELGDIALPYRDEPLAVLSVELRPYDAAKAYRHDAITAPITATDEQIATAINDAITALSLK
jgi:hypothetical protein